MVQFAPINPKVRPVLLMTIVAPQVPTFVSTVFVVTPIAPMGVWPVLQPKRAVAQTESAVTLSKGRTPTMSATTRDQPPAEIQVYVTVQGPVRSMQPALRVGPLQEFATSQKSAQAAVQLAQRTAFCPTVRPSPADKHLAIANKLYAPARAPTESPPQTIQPICQLPIRSVCSMRHVQVLRCHRVLILLQPGQTVPAILVTETSAGIHQIHLLPELAWNATRQPTAPCPQRATPQHTSARFSLLRQN